MGGAKGHPFLFFVIFLSALRWVATFCSNSCTSKSNVVPVRKGSGVAAKRDGQRAVWNGGQSLRRERKKTAIDCLLFHQLTAVRRPPPREPPEPLGQAPVPGLGAAAADAGRLAGRGVAAHEARGGAGGAQSAEERGRELMRRRGGGHVFFSLSLFAAQIVAPFLPL